MGFFFTFSKLYKWYQTLHIIIITIIFIITIVVIITIVKAFLPILCHPSHFQYQIFTVTILAPIIVM